MTVQIFLTLIVAFSTATSLITEAIKMIFTESEIKIPYNILVLIVAVVVACTGTAIYYLQVGIPFTALNIIYIFLMGVANWIGAMVGYDKIKQLIGQIGA